MKAVEIANLYRGVVEECLAEARARIIADKSVEMAIKDAFSASIPLRIPRHLSDHVDKRALPQSLQSEAARLLRRICSSMPQQLGPFVTAVSDAARSRTLAVDARGGVSGRREDAKSSIAFNFQMRPRIQLLIFAGCPLAELARASLKTAMAEAGASTYEEVDILSASTPEELRAWASPTILVDGRDVSGGFKGAGQSCRAYAGADCVPTAEVIASAIKQGM